MDSLLYDWGVAVDKSLLISDNNEANLVNPQSAFFIKTYINAEGNEYSGAIADPENPVAIFSASPIELVGSGASGATSVVSLLETAASSYGINEEIYAARMADPSVPFPQGPFNVMTVSRKGVKSEAEGLTFSNLLVITDSTMLEANLTSASYYNNGDYFISVLNAMTGRSDTVSIVSKSAGDTTFPMDQQIYDNMTIVYYYVLPGIVVIIAAVIILRRRHK
jgi:hypothetical protein